MTWPTPDQHRARRGAEEMAAPRHGRWARGFQGLLLLAKARPPAGSSGSSLVLPHGESHSQSTGCWWMGLVGVLLRHRRTCLMGDHGTSPQSQAQTQENSQFMSQVPSNHYDRWLLNKSIRGPQHCAMVTQKCLLLLAHLIIPGIFLLFLPAVHKMQLQKWFHMSLR